MLHELQRYNYIFTRLHLRNDYRTVCIHIFTYFAIELWHPISSFKALFLLLENATMNTVTLK